MNKKLVKVGIACGVLLGTKIEDYLSSNSIEELPDNICFLYSIRRGISIWESE